MFTMYYIGTALLSSKTALCIGVKPWAVSSKRNKLCGLHGYEVTWICKSRSVMELNLSALLSNSALL